MIQAVIYDLGGVIFDLNYQLTTAAFTQLGSVDFEQVYSQRAQLDLFDKFEEGKIDPATFRAGLRKLLKLDSVSDQQLDDAWNAMLLDLPPENLEAVAAVKARGLKTYLFSNSNAIHIKRAFEISREKANIETFDAYFDSQYYSFSFGMRKPHKEGFQKILVEQQLQPNETLFVDDSPQHLEGARQAGIHACLIDSETTVHDVPRVIDELNARMLVSAERALSNGRA
jgi:putative hydrolase of the HAD superfamily